MSEGLEEMFRVKGEGKEKQSMRSFEFTNAAIKTVNKLTSSVPIHEMGIVILSLQSGFEDSLS